MLSGKLQGNLLKLLVNLMKPQNILELGTFTGYATIAMLEGCNDNEILKKIDTCDIDEVSADIAQKYFDQFKNGNKVCI